MTITNSEQIIVIILAATLAIYLLVSVVAIIKVVQILNHIKAIIKKAEEITDKAESVTQFFQNTAGPVAIGKLISNIFNASQRNNRRKDKGE